MILLNVEPLTQDNWHEQRTSDVSNRIKMLKGISLLSYDNMHNFCGHELVVLTENQWCSNNNLLLTLIETQPIFETFDHNFIQNELVENSILVYFDSILNEDEIFCESIFFIEYIISVIPNLFDNIVSFEEKGLEWLRTLPCSLKDALIKVDLLDRNKISLSWFTTFSKFVNNFMKLRITMSKLIIKLDDNMNAAVTRYKKGIKKELELDSILKKRTELNKYSEPKNQKLFEDILYTTPVTELEENKIVKKILVKYNTRG